MEHPLVTVVLPVRNEAQHIGACLDTVLAQDFRDFEIVAVDGESDDETVEIVERAAARTEVPIQVVRNTQRTVPNALNLGTRAGRGALIVRIDGHATVGPDYLARIVDHLTSGRWAGVGGRKVAVGETAVGRAFQIAFASALGAGDSTYHHGTRTTEVEHVPFGAYPRYVVEALGGWDPGLAVNQDYEFDHRVGLAGGRLLFDPAIEIRWRERDGLPAIARQYHRYGRGKVAMIRKHPRSLRWRQLAPPALAAGTMATTLLAGLTRRAVFLAPIVAYAGAVTVGAQIAARRSGAPPAVRRRVAPVIVTMHQAWGIGFLRGLAATGGSRCRPSPS